jgi:hypothetical protein
MITIRIKKTDTFKSPGEDGEGRRDWSRALQGCSVAQLYYAVDFSVDFTLQLRDFKWHILISMNTDNHY